MNNVYLIIWLSIVGVLSFISFLYYLKDWRGARLKRIRYPEVVSLIITAWGGFIGSIIGTMFLGHKSNAKRKWYFYLTIIVSTAVNVLIFYLLIKM